MNSYKYIIGIDLGTSNTVVSYARIRNDETEPEFEIFKIPQIVKPGEILEKEMLPSFVYFPDDNEKNRSRFTMPWESEETFIIGEYAKIRGGEVPSRQISSAKSWLCNPHAKRENKILPWNSESVIEKLSPVDVQSEILQHIKNAWNFKFAQDNSDNSFEKQKIIITVPASFDTVARELTLKSAKKTGIIDLTLMEEPQAVFYSWLFSHGDSSDSPWRDEIKAEDIVLVCDIGGGTSDFSLIKVNNQNGELELERIAVGNHLLVGGDNMDLALSYFLRSKFASSGKNLDPWQMRILLNKARETKEVLSSGGGKDSKNVIIPGKGMKLIGGSLKSELSFNELQQMISAGFFPECNISEEPSNNQTTGLREVGLLYESDPAITKHIAKFLKKSLPEGTFPTHVIFNGGVMQSQFIKKQLKKIVSSWGNDGITELTNIKTSLAVAIGAGYYGFVKENNGLRIKSGLNKSYYIEVASSMPSIPGIPLPTKALCVGNFGAEEGSIIKIKEKEYMLVLGEEVTFSLLASDSRKEDIPGTEIEDFNNELEPINEIKAMLKGEPGETIPVILEIHLTEVGTMDFFCASISDEKKWKLEFDLR